MADHCKKCDGEFSNPREVFKCKDCGVFFHQQCMDPTKSKVGTRNNVRCEGCAAEMSSTGSRTSDSAAAGRDTAVLDAIAALRKDLTDRADQQLEKLNSVQGVLSAVVQDVTDLKNQCNDLKTTSDNTVETVGQLREENAGLSRFVHILQQRVEELQQHTRKNNVLISGVPVTPREDVFAILASIAGCLGVKFHAGDVSAVHRLPGSRDSSRPPSIVVCFVSRAVKMMWVSARRARRSLTAKEIGASFPDEQVYVNEHLTTETREIFNGARNLVKSKKLEAVWTSDCRVLGKKTAMGIPFRIHSLRQIRELDGLIPHKEGTSLTPKN